MLPDPIFQAYTLKDAWLNFLRHFSNGFGATGSDQWLAFTGSEARDIASQPGCWTLGTAGGSNQAVTGVIGRSRRNAVRGVEAASAVAHLVAARQSLKHPVS